MRLWDALIAAGTPYGITPAGIWALDVARIEAGLILLDVDYVSARHALIERQKSSPLELGLGWTVNLDEAGLRRQRGARGGTRARAPAWQFVGVDVDWESLEALLRRGRAAAAAARRSRGATSVPLYAERPPGRLRHERVLVAAAQAVPRARARRGAMRRSRAPQLDDRGHGRASAQARRARACGRLPFFNPERKRA